MVTPPRPAPPGTAQIREATARGQRVRGQHRPGHRRHRRPAQPAVRSRRRQLPCPWSGTTIVFAAELMLPELIEAAVRSDQQQWPAPRSPSWQTGPAQRATPGRLGASPLPGAARGRQQRRRPSTWKRSASSGAPTRPWTWPARTCCTASGCAAAERRRDARVQLRTANDMFHAMGAGAFAEQAAVNCAPPANGPENGRRKQTATSPPRNPASRPRRRRRDQQRDRRATVPQSQHRRLPPRQGLQETRRQIPDRSSRTGCPAMNDDGGDPLARASAHLALRRFSRVVAMRDWVFT